jgi:hypothetical protein
MKSDLTPDTESKSLALKPLLKKTKQNKTGFCNPKVMKL